ncbi:MAG: hypothetical protein LBP50_11350, partial [Tannerella sp.]|nr:hypothetical protein [Tannerella sp.]
MKVYRGDTEIADVFVRTENSYESEEIMGDHTVHIEFDVLEPIEFRLGDHVTVNSRKFLIRYNESVKKEERSRGFRYAVTFHAEMYGLQDTLFFLFGEPERLKNHDFYNGTAAQWADLLIENMNRNESGWSVGSVIESEAVNLSFRDKTCAEVLNELVSENCLDTEYFFTGKTLHIGRREYSSNGLSLSQGAGGGLRDVELSAVDDTPPVTVLFPYGSDKNITKEYGNDYLVLPGGALSMEKNTDKYGRIEKSMQFENIFPKGEFHVSAKIDDFTLQASDIDFNLTDCLIDGVEAIVTFQGTSGLAGYDLAIVEGSWDNTAKQFKLKKNEEENALEVPGDIHFAEGDMFILTGIKMPQSYITAAELKLKAAAQEYLNNNSEKRVQLQCRCDDIYFRQHSISVACGQLVEVVEARLEINREIRCTAVRRYLENAGNPVRYELTLSDFLRGNGLKGIVSAVRNVPQEIVRNVRPVKEYTKRSWRDVMATMEMMFDPDGNYFTDIIKPLVVHTAQLIVGTQSQQFELVGVRFSPNHNDSPNEFFSTAGQLIHFTIDPDGERTWNIAESNVGNLEDSQAYYVYAKCGLEGEGGEILVTTQKIKMLDDADYYHFWVGVLNVPEDGVRSWQPMHGYTEITGNQITTGVIKDKLANLVIDLVHGEITGKVTFGAGTTGYPNIADKPDLTAYEEAVNYIDNVLPDELERLQNQIDDNIESHFYHYDPTLSNIPASEWTTAAMKDAHLDDTFTNLDSGQSWRFTKSSGNVYSWTLMADSAATKALVLAGQAKDTADGKRRVFLNVPPARPVPPYDRGDLWLQGTSGDIMRCDTARSSGSGSLSDWVKASKYTDDGALNSFLQTYTTDQSDIKSQLDGKIETWFQASDPSSSWTAAERAAHTGDLWYYTSGKLLYRYTGSAWSKIEDADAIAAAAAAAAAQTQASSKAVTFTSQPQPPYKVGDLWLDGDSQSGSMKKCKTGRTGGSFSSGDWENVGIYDNAGVAMKQGLNISGGFLTFNGNGGMSGTDDIRIWSGGSISNPTFSVKSNGNVHSNGTITAKNDIL